MKQNIGVAAMAAILLATAACSSSGGDDSNHGTGTSRVDAVLKAVETNDPAEIEAFIRLAPAICPTVQPDALPLPSGVLPLCSKDEAPGTVVDTFFFGSCEGSYYQRATAKAETEGIVKQELGKLYGVYEAVPGRLPGADFVAIFYRTTAERTSGFALYLANGGIVGTDEDCGYPPDKLVDLLKLTKPVLVD